MRPTLLFLLFFATAFGLTHLLDLVYIQSNWLRYALVVLLIVILLAVGAMWIREEIKKW